MWPKTSSPVTSPTPSLRGSLSVGGRSNVAHPNVPLDSLPAGFVFFTITRESIFYINLRQAYALSPAYASRLSSRTVLFTAVTEKYLNRDKVRQMFGPSKVKNVWIATDTSKLEDKVKERDDAAMKLEAAETKLIVLANKARLKALKKQGNVEDGPLTPENVGDAPDDESGSVAARWVSPKDRPTHRLKFLIGKKVDTINWARSEIERLTPEIEELQAKHRAGDAKLVSSVFVEFYQQADAQSAFQSGMSCCSLCQRHFAF